MSAAKIRKVKEGERAASELFAADVRRDAEAIVHQSGSLVDLGEGQTRSALRDAAAAAVGFGDPMQAVNVLQESMLKGGQLEQELVRKLVETARVHYAAHVAAEMERVAAEKGLDFVED